MSDIVGAQKNCYIHHKKFAWRSNRIVSSQDNMAPTVESSITSKINGCLNSVESGFAPVSNPLNDRPLSVETQSATTPFQPDAEAPLDFSVRHSSNTEQSQNESNESPQGTEFYSKIQKYSSENFSTPDKASDKDMYNGNSSPVHINVKSEYSSPNRNSMNGFSAASHNSDIRLHNSHRHLENGKEMRYFNAENGQRINASQYEPVNMQKGYTEHSQQLKIVTENGKEVNGVNLNEDDPSSSPTHSSSLSLESSPPNRHSSSILEEALVGNQGERAYVHGVYPFAQNYNFHESNNKSMRSTPNSNISTRLPKPNTEASRSFSRETVPLSNTNAAVGLGFPASVSPLGLTDVNSIMPGINSLIPMTNPLISPASFPLHNALSSGTLNGMNPFLMSSLNSRLPQINSGADRKTGKPLRPFKALAGDLLLGMAQRVPMSHALYPGYNVTGFTNGYPDPLRSNSAPKKIPRESEKAAENETQTVVGTSNSNDSNGSHNEVNDCNLEPVESSNSANRKRSRLPEDQKDEAYWERRRKNNEAAKRSRDARRVKEDMITHTACALSQENMKLSLNFRRLQEDHGNLLLQIKSLMEDKQRMDIQMELLKSELMSTVCRKCGSTYSKGHDKKAGLD